MLCVEVTAASLRIHPVNTIALQSSLLYRLRNMESDGALYVQTEKMDSEDPFSSGENE